MPRILMKKIEKFLVRKIFVIKKLQGKPPTLMISVQDPDP
jgi:hypothetical protein